MGATRTRGGQPPEASVKWASRSACGSVERRPVTQARRRGWRRCSSQRPSRSGPGTRSSRASPCRPRASSTKARTSSNSSGSSMCTTSSPASAAPPSASHNSSSATAQSLPPLKASPSSSPGKRRPASRSTPSASSTAAASAAASSVAAAASIAPPRIRLAEACTTHVAPLSLRQNRPGKVMKFISAFITSGFWGRTLPS